MPALPEAAAKAWDERNGPAVLTTVDENGTPNAVYVGAVKKTGDDRIAIVDNYFHKTRANIRTGGRASLLYIDKNRRAFQIKGRIEYAAGGPAYEDMLTWASDKHPREAVAVMIAEEVYSGAERLL